MSKIEKRRWQALGLSCLNVILLIWLWVPSHGHWPQLNLTLTTLTTVTVVYLVSLVAPFLLATTYHWTAWQVAAHWALAWFSYNLLAVIWPFLLKTVDKPLVGIGALFSFFGLLCVDAPPNHVLGFRIGWTYRSPIIWRKTNALGGWLLFVTGGLLVVFSAWRSSLIPVLLTGMILISGVIPIGYAYWLAHRPNHLV
ncbi:SdpI family protein [Lactiplantibacillus daowaiensis]|uniref:SdpI family protein n=1 Tax=Lactiplantibacillus daowaiensis TaxID=2559918 RepID=A0ABW1S315_9LACO|nr:SdpI family protein [Lactiplantibacillus daowaiensis]